MGAGGGEVGEPMRSLHNSSWRSESFSDYSPCESRLPLRKPEILNPKPMGLGLYIAMGR